MLLPRVEDLQSSGSAIRQVRFSEAGIAKSGEQFEAAFPFLRVTPAASGLVFSPAFQAGDSGLGQAAYALYSFQADGYDREPELRLRWAASPVSGTAHLALANFETSRWDWFELDATAELHELSSIQAYLSEVSTLIAVVLVTGDTPAQLDRIRLGPPYPLAELSVDPQQGTAPLEVTLDASASSTPDGVLVDFEWDFDGDGNFDANTAGNSSVLHTYEAGGDFRPAVRVSNDAGKSALASSSLALQDEWRHSFYAGGYWLHFNDIVPDSEGGFYAVGHYIVYQIETDIPYMLVSRWNRDGELLWCYGKGAASSSAEQCGIDGEGNLVVTGDYSESGLLLKWNRDGELLWSKSYVRSTQALEFSSLRVASDAIYVCGRMSDMADSDLLLMKADNDGNVLWARSYSWFQAGGVDLGLRGGAASDPQIFALASIVKTTAPASTFPLVVAFDPEGNYKLDARRDNASLTVSPRGLALEALPGDAVTRVYIASEYQPGSDSELLLSAVDLSEQTALTPAVVYDHSWLGSGSDIPLQLQLAGNQLCVAGKTGNWASLWVADAESGTVSSAESFLPQLGVTAIEGLRLLDGGRLCYCGSTQVFQGQWQTLPGTQQNSESSWLAAAGSVSNESISSGPGIDEFNQFTNTGVDPAGDTGQALIGYRRLPLQP